MAIAFLGTGDAGTTASSGSHSASITIPASTDLLVVIAASTILNGTGTAAPNAGTVAGNAMTFVAQTPTADQNTEWISMLFYLSPPTGLQTVAVSGAAGTGTKLDTSYSWAAYSGVAQSGQPDSSGKTNQTTTTALGISTTVVGSNCWLVGGFGSQNLTGFSLTNGTSRTTATPNDSYGIFDSNGTVGTGSQTITVNLSNQLINGLIASFSPAAAVASTRDARYLPLLGVG